LLKRHLVDGVYAVAIPQHVQLYNARRWIIGVEGAASPPVCFSVLNCLPAAIWSILDSLSVLVLWRFMMSLGVGGTIGIDRIDRR
jgi:hypothetical protein